MKRQLPIILGCILLFMTLLTITLHSPLSVFLQKDNSPVIVIDVGHGGSDPGKVSLSGIKEKDINLQIAEYLRDYLIAQDFTVFLTRDSDCGLYDSQASNKKTSDLNNRIQFIQNKKAACTISIHQNSFPDSSVHGAQCFYYTTNEESRLLAQYVQEALLQLDDSNHRTHKANDSYYLLKHTTKPAIIVECGFLSNPTEEAKLTDSNYQKQIAYSISLGVNRFMNKLGTEFPIK